MGQPGRPGGFDMARVSMGSKGLLITGVLLFIALFFPWEDFGGEVEDVFGVDVPGATVNGFNGVGVIVAILVIGLLVWEGLIAAGVTMNLGTTSPALISAVIGGATVLFALIKFLTSLDAIAWGAFLGLVLALAMAYAAYVRFQESKTTTAPPPA